MNIEDLRNYCLLKKGACESFPFDESTLVFKVEGKMFLLTDLSDDFSINIKCTPEKALELREHYPCVKPGYHMNKKYWVTVEIDGSVGDDTLYAWINESYRIVVAGLPRSIREKLQ